MQKIVFVLLSGILLLNGCSSKRTVNEESARGFWQLYDIAPKDESNADFSQTAVMKQMLQKGSVLCFFDDGRVSVIDINGNFLNGNWKAGNSGRSISLSGGGLTGESTISADKDEKGKDRLKLEIVKADMVIRYIKVAEALKKETDDPFHAENNKWRSKPQAPEDSVAIAARMANYFKHLALILKAVKERKQEIVSFGFSQGPVRIYSGGIGIFPFEETPESWKKSFYNDSNALEGHRQFANYLRKSRYRAAGTGDWIDDDYNILLTIYAGFQPAPKNTQ